MASRGSKSTSANNPPAQGEASSGTHDRTPVEGNIGFVGLGRMGSAMAANLAASGCRVTGYVRHPERVAALAPLGIRAVSDIAALADCDFIISMVPDDAAAREVVFGENRPGGHPGLLSVLKDGAVHVSMSTISPTTSAELAGAHGQHNQGYVAAPVFGNPDAAKARELFIITAGVPSHVERCRPIFDLLGQRTFVLQSDPPGANLVKLAGNAMIANTLEILGETIALVRKRGLDAEQFLDIMTSTLFGSRVFKVYGPRIVSQHHQPGFVFPLALKDVRLALAEADAAGVPMPTVSAVHDRLVTGVARGYAGMDWSALGRLAAEEAGLDGAR
jgi:3-hydroxyisobutyrate dehydrogenase-like beta-hydroxyacid dehydrogenase